MNYCFQWRSQGHAQGCWQKGVFFVKLKMRGNAWNVNMVISCWLGIFRDLLHQGPTPLGHPLYSNSEKSPEENKRAVPFQTSKHVYGIYKPHQRKAGVSRAVLRHSTTVWWRPCNCNLVSVELEIPHNVVYYLSTDVHADYLTLILAPLYCVSHVHISFRSRVCLQVTTLPQDIQTKGRGCDGLSLW